MRAGAAALLVLSLAACASDPAPPVASPSPSATTVPTTVAPTTPSATPTPTRPRGEVTLVFGGDVDLDRTTRTAIANGGVDAPWRHIAPTLRAADLAFLNLECAVSTRGKPEIKTYTFRGHPSALAGAKNAGVDVFSLANNHILDYGVDAMFDTIRHVNATGIKTTGAGRTLDEAQAPAVFTVNGRRIAFLGISQFIPAPKWKATATRPGFAYDDDVQIAKQVRAAKRVADIVIPYFHWGVEYTYSASFEQRRAARAAIRAGATMVIGGHPHVFQPVEVIEGRMVAWSLGNLVFQSTPRAIHTQLLKVTIEADGAVAWETEPYLIRSGVPEPEPSRKVLRGRIPA